MSDDNLFFLCENLDICAFSLLLFSFLQKNLYLNEEPVRQLHDVGLVDGRDAGAAVVTGVLEGILGLSKRFFGFYSKVEQRSER